MRVEVNLRRVPIGAVPDVVGSLAAAGVAGVCDAEVRRDPLITMTLAATATRTMTLSTAVSLAFPRSPMVLAYAARSLSEISGGRFRLGLGSQVKRHMERRFGVPWTPPGPRLRDYVQALRAIWRTWDGAEPLDHRGSGYRLDLMPPEFDLGPSGHGAIPIDLAAVNPHNIRLAAELCDGIRLHPFVTPGYLRDVIWPELRAGAAGRDLSSFEVFGGGLVSIGVTDADVEKGRERARERVAFYGSTYGYRPVLDHHGWGDLQRQLRHLADHERWSEMSGLVDDEVLDAFCVSVPYPRLASALHDRFGGLVTTVQLQAPPLPVDVPAMREACTQLADVAA